MVFRFIFRYLANNEQLIERLSQSYPIRRAAQLTAYFLTKGRYKGQEALEQVLKSEGVRKIEEEVTRSGSRLKSFKNRFAAELKEEVKKMKTEVQSKNPKDNS